MQSSSEKAEREVVMMKKVSAVLVDDFIVVAIAKIILGGIP